MRKKSNREGFGCLGIGAAEVSPRAVGPRMKLGWFRLQDLAWIEQKDAKGLRERHPGCS